jgi:hypothetical protein
VTEIVAPPAPGDRIGIFGRWSGSRDEPALGPYIFVGVEPNGRWLLRYYRWPDARRMSLPVECINAENPRMWATAAEIEAGPGWYTRHRDDKWMIPKQEEAEMKDDIARPPKPSPARADTAGARSTAAQAGGRNSAHRASGLTEHYAGERARPKDGRLTSGPLGRYVLGMKDITQPRRRGRPHGPRPAVSARRSTMRLTDPELIVRAMDAVKDTFEQDYGEPLTDKAFAEAILLCHPRTLRKYLDGRPLPALAREKLVKLVKAD